MDYVRFGGSNLLVSRLALGAMGFGSRAWREWVLDEADSGVIVKTALDAGINLFDTCDFYSIGASETILGRTLLSYVSRDSVILATKVGNPMGPHPNARGFSRKHVLDAVDASLKRLGTDYIDIYQTHIWDQDTDLEELVDVFADVVRAGKARYIGVTTMPAWTLGMTLQIASSKGLPRFVSMQCEYNLCHREAERELIPLCRNEGIALIPFSPFARGFLCADRRKPENASPRTQSDDYTKKYYHRGGDYAVYEAAAAIAEKRGAAPGQIALAWMLRQPGITAPIFGATRPEHVGDAIAAMEIQLDDEEIAALEGAYQPRPPRAEGH